jgi:hypothetical protein
MPAIHSEQDLVHAVASAVELQNRAYAILLLIRKHANNVFISIPSEKMVVSIEGMSQNEAGVTYIDVACYYEVSSTHHVTHYYDSDDDNYREGWGADNTCGTSTYTTQSPEQRHYKLPFHYFRKTEEDLTAYLVESRIRHDANLRREQLLRQKAKLEADLLEVSSKLQ